jgi:DNA-binding NarL/FixJ family response regulator
VTEADLAAGDDAAPIAVLVIDDHQMVAESMVRLLRDEPDLDVVGFAITAEEGLALAHERRIDVVIVDHALPDLDGVATIRLLRASFPEINIVLLIEPGHEDTLVAAIEAGCVGWLEKRAPFAELTRAVRLAAGGEIVLSAAQLSRLLPSLAPVRRSQRMHGDLSAREVEVLALMAEGLSNKAVAAQLGLHLNTVRNHVQHLLQKLSAHSKLEAVAAASRQGLLRGIGGTDNPDRRLT